MKLEQKIEYEEFRREMQFLNATLTQENRHVNLNLTDLYTVCTQDMAKRYDLEIEDVQMYYKVIFGEYRVFKNQAI